MQANVPVDLPTLKDLSAIAAENTPGDIAVADGIDGRSLTWEEFDEESNRAAHGLKEYVGQGDRVAFLSNPSVDHAVLWNGANKAGCLVSNLHTRVAPDVLRYCIDELRPRVLVIDPAFGDLFRDRVQELITTSIDAIVTMGTPQSEDEIAHRDLIDGRPTSEPDVLVHPNDVTAILWTSGTTGRPKGWCHTSRGLVLKSYKTNHVSRNARYPVIYDPGFAAWWATTIPAFVKGAGVYFMGDWEPRRYLRMIEERELTNASLVPTMWREILRRDDFDEFDLSSLERVGASGERLDTTTLEMIRDDVCEQVSNAYAATEVNVTEIRDDELSGDRVQSVGRPTTGTLVRVVPEGGDPDEPLPTGEVGEIIVKGEDRAVWAWGNTAKTEEVFRDGWWYSGDLGYKDEDGYLYLQGRADFMILSKGIKVYPVPVEERLNAHPDVAEAAVIGVEDEEYGEQVTAVVSRTGEVSPEELDEWCLSSDALARHERPRAYHFVEGELPRTSTEKLDRSTVKDEYI